MTDVIKAPWSDEQIKLFNNYQYHCQFHPYTCGKDSNHRLLVATVIGFVCLDCDYRQHWAYDMPHELVK